MIRLARPEDLPELVELCRLHAAYEEADYIENGQAERLHAALFRPSPSLHAWVVERTVPGIGQLAGYLTAVVEFATWPARDFVYMDCLYLREDCRRMGLGSALMRTLSEFAAEKGLREIQWQTPPGNDLGIGFYRRIGASGRDKLRFSLTVDAQDGERA